MLVLKKTFIFYCRTGLCIGPLLNCPIGT